VAKSGCGWPRPHELDARNVNRSLLYVGSVAGFIALAGIGAAAGGSADPRFAYVCALFLVCASPILFVDKLNGRYMLLCIFLPIYFMTFGASDLLDLFLGPAPVAPSGSTGKAEIAIVLGAALIILGYRAIAELAGRVDRGTSAKDWPAITVAIVGFIVWVVGVAATWVWQVQVLKRAWDPLRDLSAVTGMALTVGRMLHPLGIALLAYGFVTTKSRLFGLLILGVVVGEFVLGFVEDSKEIAIEPAVIVLVAKFLVDGRIPKSWLIAVFAVVILTFPIFQAYRAEVLADRGISRADAATNLVKNIEIALTAERQHQKEVVYSSRSFLARASYKPTVEMIIERVGVTAPFQNGHTLLLIFEGFVPRVIWPTKPDTSIGQLFNRELHITETRDNYVSTTVLGELYWNFSWLGIIVGCPLLGLFLGTVNRRCDLSQSRSVTRFLIFCITAYGFCFRFEDGLAMTSTIWIRTLFAIGVLHMLFARTSRAVAVPAHRANLFGTESRKDAENALPYPNLLR
jgi:hypothetical protein